MSFFLVLKSIAQIGVNSFEYENCHSSLVMSAVFTTYKYVFRL